MNTFTAEIKSFLDTIIDNQIPDESLDFPNSPFEYLFVAEKNILIHCIFLNGSSSSLDRFLFQKLSNEFFKKGILIIHIWEDVWRSRKIIVRSRLLVMFGKAEKIPARLTSCRRIDKVTLDLFLNHNHLQGTCGAKYKYGLFLPKKYFRILHQPPESGDELLVAVASFGACLKKKQGDGVYRSFELIRFASLLSKQVVGGMDKLLQGFIREQQPDDIMTYADMDWSDGKSYRKLGFELVGQTIPLVFSWDNQLSKRVLCTKDTPDSDCVLLNAGNWKFVKKLKND